MSLRRRRKRTRLSRANRTYVALIGDLVIASEAYDATCALSDGLVEIPSAIKAAQRAGDRAWLTARLEASRSLRISIPLAHGLLSLLLAAELHTTDASWEAIVKRAKREVGRALQDVGIDPATMPWTAADVKAEEKHADEA